MEENNQTTPPRGAALTAHIISDVFSPLLIPTYAMILAMWLTYLQVLPTGVRIRAVLGVAFITAFLPLLVIAVLIRKGKVTDRAISDRRQRLVPFAAAIVCYLGACGYLMSLHAPGWMVMFVFGAAVVTVLAIFISRRWKISAHTSASGGLCAMIFWLARNHMIFGDPLVWVSGVILLLGAVAWARLALNHHTPLQTLAGAALGFAVEYILLITL